MSAFLPTALLAVVCGLGAAPVFLGEEQFGNEPVPRQTEWADGVLETANDAARVYRRWINGNEDFVFRGDGSVANRLISLFSKVADPGKSILLLPTKGSTRSFKKIEVGYDVRLHVPSGIYLGMAKRESDHPVFERHPSLTIHLGGALELGSLKIPAGVTTIGADDMVKKYRAGLESSSNTTRGQACYLLKDYGWVKGVTADLQKVLGGSDDWMRLNALPALGTMGSYGLPAVPAIKTLRKDTQDDRTRQACDRALESLQAAKKPTEASPIPAQADTIRAWLTKRTGK